MAMSPEQLSSTLKHLKRAPAPKVPIVASSGAPEQVGPINLRSITLKKTGKRESLIEVDSIASSLHEKENNPDELNSIFKKKFAKFDHQDDTPNKPRVMPKPKLRKRSEGEERDQVTMTHSESFPRSTQSRDSNGNLKLMAESAGTPTLKPLPTLHAIGKIPPPKPTKPLILAMKIQKQYKHHKVMIAPKVQQVIAEAVKNGRNDQDVSIEEEDGEDIYDDICNAEEPPQVSYRPQPKQPEVPEPIDDDMYDDVEQLAETVKAQLAQDAQRHPTNPSDTEPITEDFYDDLNTSQLPTTAGSNSVIDIEEGEFGEDLYQPVEGVMDFEQANGIEAELDDDMIGQEKIQPPPPSNKEEDIKKKEKKDKEKEKKERELQKKKEKEEQRRKKEEEKQERDRKKKEEEERRRRDKFDKDLKKVHKLKGNEDIITKGTTQEDFAGTGKELPCTKGTILEVIVKDNCPSGKWLVRNPQGHLGYVPSSILQLEVTADESAEALDEDLYECVDTFKSEPPPIPSASSIPTSTPSIPPSIPDDELDDVYDDTLIIDEDLYDDIPGADM